MSPHRRKGSPYWQVAPRVTIPGRGRVRLPARSTGTESKQRAQAMAATLAELPQLGYLDLLERYIEDPALTPAELHAAKLAGRLEDVRRQARDPQLGPLIDALEPSDPRVRQGAARLPRLVAACGGEGQRLSWLLDPKNLQAVLEAREAEGVKRNSVRRAEYRALSELLQEHVGRAAKEAVLAEVDFAQEDDTRHIFLRPEEIDRLLFQAHDPLFHCALLLVLGSGIDRSPLLRIRPRHFEDPLLQVQDTKSRARFRTLELGPVAAGALRRAIMLSGAGADERVFAWTVGQLRHLFESAVERAKLDRIVLPDDTETRLRFKDLRGVFATYWLRAGGDPRELQRILGHTRIETTLRYIKRLPIEEAGQMAAVEERQGLQLLGLVREAG